MGQWGRGEFYFDENDFLSDKEQIGIKCKQGREYKKSDKQHSDIEWDFSLFKEGDTSVNDTAVETGLNLLKDVIQYLNSTCNVL